jgi:hypothetical protein
MSKKEEDTGAGTKSWEEIQSVTSKVSHEVTQHLSANPNRHQPLVILIGTVHGKSQFDLLKLCLMEELIDAGYKVAVGFEQPHNFLEQKLRSFANDNNVALLHNNQNDVDQLTIKTALSHHDYFYSDLSRKLLLNEIVHKNISTRFNDAAICGWLELDMNDEMTKRVSDAVRTNFDKNFVSAADSDGMQIRNRVMAENILRHAHDVSADIYIQSCGYEHIAGSGYSAPSKLSLCDLFNRAGADYKLIIPENYKCNPRDTHSIGQPLRLKLSHDEEFKYNPYNKEVVWEREHDFVISTFNAASRKFDYQRFISDLKTYKQEVKTKFGRLGK